MTLRMLTLICAIVGLVHTADSFAGSSPVTVLECNKDSTPDSQGRHGIRNSIVFPFDRLVLLCQDEVNNTFYQVETIGAGLVMVNDDIPAKFTITIKGAKANNPIGVYGGVFTDCPRRLNSFAGYQSNAIFFNLRGICTVQGTSSKGAGISGTISMLIISRPLDH